jgi:hypothetical protein
MILRTKFVNLLAAWSSFLFRNRKRRIYMSNQITRGSMEFIAGEIMDAIHDSDRLEDGINRIREILECNGIVEIIPD